MKYAVNAATLKSRYHKQNEDSYVSNNNYIVIADGMGGESDGNIASKITVDVISEILEDSLSNTLSPDNLKELSLDAIRKADEEIMEYIYAHPNSSGMGTTVVVVIIVEQIMYVSWCGDSRCYVYSQSRGIQCLTKDHSYVQCLIDYGQITEKESFSHPDSNIITRFVGGGEDTCIPEYTTYKLDADDIVIVCSDGLSGYCMNDDIENAIKATYKTKQISNNLLKLALSHGSNDDITIVSMIPEKRDGIDCSLFKRLINHYHI